MAQVGDQLTQPEEGWKRVEDTDTSIKYIGTWHSASNSTLYSGGTMKYTDESDSSVYFMFSGNKIRLIAYSNSRGNDSVIVKIDGVEYTFSMKVGSVSPALVFEALNLTGSEHVFELIAPSSTDTNNQVRIDAVDIDINAYIYQPPAQVGDQLTAPEEGWKRYDDTHPAIRYEGDWIRWDLTGVYNNIFHYTSDEVGEVHFSFYGDKIRYIGRIWSSHYSDGLEAYIDGVLVSSFSQLGEANTEQVLNFEKTGLDLGKHNVVVKRASTSDTANFMIDAIDIGDNGRLLHPDEVTDVRDLDIGKRIRCHYTAKPDEVGYFYGLGKEHYVDGINDFIPPESTNEPDGDFYFIMVDDEFDGRRKLIADRPIQNEISWDTLNSAGIASGSGIESNVLFFELPVIYSNDSDTISVRASSENDSNLYMAWRALNPQTDTAYGWGSDSSLEMPQWLEIDLKSSKKFNSYSFTTRDANVESQPLSWNIEASNDQLNWDILDSRTSGIVPNYTRRSFFFDNNKEYRYYRINILECSRSFVVIRDLSFSESEKYSSSTIRLITGGVNSSDTDNEWDEHIVNSDLNGTITPGDDDVWNWSGKGAGNRQAWTTTTVSGSPSNRIARGASTNISLSQSIATNNLSINRVFRPVLLIDIPSLYKSLILYNNHYYKYDNISQVWIDLGVVPTEISAKETLFLEEGMDDLTGIDSNVLKQLEDDVLYLHTYKPK
ncbi:discoidin domain-containing protein [Halalkalibacter oceani]|uniref:discoidin domain-containing protein n=1 Tax=Halalkalibacter oceani TaxID=1653776 RepID=UPI003397B652